MRYELHCNGQVFSSEDLGHLKRVASQMADEYVIYEYRKSKMSALPKIHDPVSVRKRSTPSIVVTVMPFKDVERANDMIARGKLKSEVAKYFHVTEYRLRISLKHYWETETKEQYASYKPAWKEKSLVESK